MRGDSCTICIPDSVCRLARSVGLGEEVRAMGVRNTYVTSCMDAQMISRLSPGASHKRGCTVEKRAPTGCDVSEQLARIMRCNSIPLCMPDAGGATEFVARGSLVQPDRDPSVLPAARLEKGEESKEETSVDGGLPLLFIFRSWCGYSLRTLRPLQRRG